MIRRKLGANAASAIRYLHTSPASAKSKPLIIAHVDKHEFHQIEFTKWKMPDKLVPWDPRRSGDLRPMDPVDPNWLQLKYRPFAEILDQLPEEQRKLFTVDFGGKMDAPRVILENMLSQTRRHKYDKKSWEYCITHCTWKIRHLQEIFKHDPRQISRTENRVLANRLVFSRHKMLTKLREADYKRFEWVIEVLGLLYKLRPPGARVQRKASVDVLVNLYCNELRDHKMAQYKAQLEEEKLPFLKFKLDTLMAIRTDEISVGLSSSVDEDIRKTRRMMLEIETSQGKNITIHPVGSEEQKQIENRKS